jgi:dipeptidyl aminopeptidase/acylaminoacyl peptidase
MTCLKKWSLPFLLMLLGFSLQAQEGYQTPPDAIKSLIEAPQTPVVSVNGTGDWMILLERPGYPAVEELAQPELRLAGIRINPRTNGSSRAYQYTGMRFKRIEDQQEVLVEGLPENPKIANVVWSPDGQKVAFTLTEDSGLSLWTVSLQNGEARPLTEAVVNDALGGSPFSWLSDSETIIYKSIVEDRGEAPQKSLVPEGPTIQETSGNKAAVRTYQDLLQNKHDEDVFRYYATSVLTKVNTTDGNAQTISEPIIVSELSPSPDGTYLMVSDIREPFSYLVPYYRFPQSINILDTDGQLVRNIADIPLAENIPQGFGAVREGPRSFEWRADRPASLYWVEAQDGGDPANEVEVRDRLYHLSAPFEGEKQAGIPFSLRFGGLSWGSDDLAVVYEYWWATRQLITSRFAPEAGADSKQLLFDRSFEDRYSDPGNFETTANEYGRQVLLTDRRGRKLYLTGQGASPEGNRPFVDEYNIASGETERLWRSEAPYYEYPVNILDISKKQVLTRRESSTMPPNYFIRNLRNEQLTALTFFKNPYPQLEGVEKQVIKYEREDGLALKGDLYLPADYDGETALPVLMWAYPDEFKSADAASQVQGSPYEFIRIGWYSPLFWVTQGYAVFDDISMPVVGEADEEPNDTFVPQLVANADAAIKKLETMGVGDPRRVAIGGHSYGAFMTANLLAHSDLFAAGIARSGAYNRTLTPFGFQAEERTYWQAPEIYYSMSPFMHADSVNEPILLIHGEADNNSGTFPLQSERFYAAIKGLGGTSRLVMLPHESHGYRAEESIKHMLWEMDRWLDKYVKNREMDEPEMTTEE